MLTLDPVHVFRVDPRTKRRVLTKENHHLTLVTEGHPTVVVQAGRVMYADGVEVEQPLPEWLRSALYRTTDEGLRQIGLSRSSLEPQETTQTLEDALSINPEVVPAITRKPGRPPKAESAKVD